MSLSIVTLTHKQLSCQLLAHGTKCGACVEYRSSLRALHSRWVKRKNWSPSTHTAPGSHTAFRRLTTPERNGRFSNLKAQARCTRKEYPSLDYKNWGNCWRTFFYDELTEITSTYDEVKKYDNNTQRIISNVCFGNNSCRLHKPNVVHKSDGITYSLVVSVFEAPIISSLHTILCGLIKLPSEKTLWDYTPWIEWNRCSTRSHSTWDCKEIDMPEEVKQHTAVVCDEVKVKDSIGCDKYSCQSLVLPAWET